MFSQSRKERKATEKLFFAGFASLREIKKSLLLLHSNIFNQEEKIYGKCK